jgi:hypothetical protein
VARTRQRKQWPPATCLGKVQTGQELTKGSKAYKLGPEILAGVGEEVIVFK